MLPTWTGHASTVKPGPGGRAEADRRLNEAHKLLDEISNMLTEMRRELLSSVRRR
jgi:hypothetical protein